MKTEITDIETSDITSIRYLIKNRLATQWKSVEPKLHQAYDLLVKKKAVYDIDLDYFANIKRNLFDMNDIYAGIIDPKLFKGGRTAIYMHTEGSQYIIVFNPKKHKSIYGGQDIAGVNIFRVFNEIDRDCIVKSWGLDSTDKWITKLDLVANTFTDVTEHSQRIDKYVVCDRPTIKRVISDINKNEFRHYSPVFGTSDNNYSLNFGSIEHCFFNIILLCVRLKIKGCAI